MCIAESIVTAAMNTPPGTVDHLKSLADYRPFVLGAYFCAFAPWGVISNIDFISEKWRTIRRTRKLVLCHLILSMLPVFYVAVYAEAQRRSNDSKELGAALVALFFNLSHFLRTLFGNMQVNAFLRWASDLADCMRAIRFEQFYSVPRENDGDKAEDIGRVLMLNNSVVDNEFGGTDVTVKFTWKSIWNSLKRGRWAPNEWLRSDHVWLSTVRWCGAFLCSMGMDWSCQVNADTLKRFFSSELRDTLFFLDCTTWNIEEDESVAADESNDKMERNNGDIIEKDLKTFSMDEMYDSHGLKVSALGCAAYDTPIPSSNDKRDSYLAYSFEFNSLCGSFPTNKNNPWNSLREDIAVELVDCLLLVKHMGVQKLRRIKRSYGRATFLNDKMWNAAFKFLLEQCGASKVLKDNSMADMFSELDRIPIFPSRLQMMTLWDKCPNKRVLQASVHNDNDAALFMDGDPADVSDQVEEFCGGPKDVYDYYKDIGRLVAKHYGKRIVCGVVAESVRSFLADWLTSSGHEPSWEPVVPTDYELEFRVSQYILGEKLQGRKTDRLLWECQRALHTEIARTYRGHEDLPSSAPLMMLFILAFPQVSIEEIVNEENGYEIIAVNPNSGDCDGKKSDESTSTSSSSHCEVNVSERVLRLWAEFVPSDVTVLIRQNLVTSQATLKLTSKCHDARFIWDDWVNAMVGFMKGMMLYKEETPKRDDIDYQPANVGMFPLHRVNLREPMLELCPLHMKPNGTVFQSDIVRVWTGWPPFDWRVCQFEVDQWLGAFDLDLNNCKLFDSLLFDQNREKPFIHEEAERAAKVVRSIITTLDSEVSIDDNQT